MKLLFKTFTLLLISVSSFAQLDKGIWLMGGSGSFYSYTEDYSTPSYNQTAKVSNIDIAASVGYFFVDKFAAGLRPYLSTYNSEVTRTSVGSGAPTYGFQIAIGPFAKYYFLNKEKPFNVLADISYQIGVNKFRGTFPEKGKFNTISFMGGTEVFFNTTASMEILLGYKHRIESIENSPSAYNRNKKGFQASIGFSLHLEKL